MIVHSAFTAHMTLLSSCCFIGEIRHQQEAPTPNTCAPVGMQQYNITARCPMLRIKMQYQGNSIVKSELCMWSPWRLRYIIKIGIIILIFVIAIKLAPIMCGLWMVTDQYSVVGMLFQNCNIAKNANSWISREKNEKIFRSMCGLSLSLWMVSRRPVECEANRPRHYDPSNYPPTVMFIWQPNVVM